jgi:hypothetical protein
MKPIYNHNKQTPIIVELLYHIYKLSSRRAGNPWNDSCRNAGFEDGRNGPFNDATYDHCGDEVTDDQASRRISLYPS